MTRKSWWGFGKTPRPYCLGAQGRVGAPKFSAIMLAYALGPMTYGLYAGIPRALSPRGRHRRDALQRRSRGPLGRGGFSFPEPHRL
ncbi:MAG: hypothetical protein CM15mP18_5170 [Methanobacteriota archaeon]|nr:MAG: hypothetical protein CM15mP18_5170 [Euryarchaeota archaeon]